MAHPLETRAQAVAEYRLTGCYRRSARATGVKDHGTVIAWVRAAENPSTPQDKSLAARAAEYTDKKKTSLDNLFDRTMELQLRDVAEADFRDRTGLLKIVNDIRLLQQGLPTAITGSVGAMGKDEVAAYLTGREDVKREAKVPVPNGG